MALVWGILFGTPLWAYGLLALLIWLGLQAARDREIHLSRVFITPAVFISWGSYRLVSQSLLTPALFSDWLIGALAGALAGAALPRLGGMGVDRHARRVRMPGHWLPLVRNLVIFGAKYGLAVAAGIQPALRQPLTPWEFAVSGASAGYFLGWLLRFAWAYRKAPDFSAPLAAE